MYLEDYTHPIRKSSNKRQRGQIIMGFLLTSLIPMIDIWPGLYLWFSYGAYNRLALRVLIKRHLPSTYTYDWLLAISVVLFAFPIIDTVFLAIKSYLLVVTVRNQPKPKIFYYSAIVDKSELILSVLPKLWTCYFFLTRYVSPTSAVPLVKCFHKTYQLKID